MDTLEDQVQGWLEMASEHGLAIDRLVNIDEGASK